jgi:hypothetical protein
MDRECEFRHKVPLVFFCLSVLSRLKVEQDLEHLLLGCLLSQCCSVFLGVETINGESGKEEKIWKGKIKWSSGKMIR